MTYNEHISLFYTNKYMNDYTQEQVEATMDIIPSVFKYNKYKKDYNWEPYTKSWREMSIEEAQNLLSSNLELSKKYYYQKQKLEKIKEDF